MAEELNSSPLLVISTPMWNFSFPYVLKQYVDIAVQPGINFLERPALGPVTAGKSMAVVTSCGGRYRKDDPRNHLGSYLKVRMREKVEISSTVRRGYFTNYC